MDRQEVIGAIELGRLIAIVRGAGIDKALRVADALQKGGVNLIEFTFDQKSPASFPDNGRMIEAVAREFAGRMLVGAGTVTSPQLVDIAADAGAGYIISPNTNERVIARTLERGLVSIPGALTPSEILTAHEAGADFVKLFPVASMGVNYVREVKAPLSHVKFLAVGGISLENAADFMALGISGVGVAAKLVNKQWVEDGEYDRITAAAQRFAALVRREESV